MQKIYGALMLLFATTFIYAQQNTEDIIYLKSGQVVRGQITDQSSDEVKVKVLGRYNFVYLMSEIDKIEKGTATTNTTPQKYKSSQPVYREPKPVAPNGYMGRIEVGYGLGTGDLPIGVGKLSFVNGYRFNPNFSLGLGIGLRMFNENDLYSLDVSDETSYSYLEIGSVVIPVFLDFRANFSTGNAAPFIGLGVGYSLDPDFGNSSMFLSPSLGIKFKTSERAALHVSVSFDHQQAMLYTYDFIEEYSYEKKMALQTISFNLGFSF